MGPEAQKNPQEKPRENPLDGVGENLPLNHQFAANFPAEKTVGEKPLEENFFVGEKPPQNTALGEIISPVESDRREFSPTPAQGGFSPTLQSGFSPTKNKPKKAEKDPQKKGRKGQEKPPGKTPSKRTSKPVLTLIKTPGEKGKPGRPRNPNLPPVPGKYYYWTDARNGLKLEYKKPGERKKYIGFIMPREWQFLRGLYDEQYILKVIIAAIRVKRARAAQDSRDSASTA